MNHNDTRKAINFAVQCHAFQKDKAGVPYIGHAFAVAMSVFEYGPRFFITGLLHDVVEDCGVNLGDIEMRFGKTVRDAVDSVTQRVVGPHNLEIYKDFIERCKQNEISRVVKIADILDNLNSERLKHLDQSTQERLGKKYHEALGVLL